MNPGGEAPVSEADHCQHTRLRLKLHYLCGFGSRLLCSSKGLNLQNIKHTTLQKNLEEYKGKKKRRTRIVYILFQEDLIRGIWHLADHA